MIALQDVPNYKPNHTDFNIYQIDESKRGWIIIISSKDPDFEKPSANIWYEVSSRGRIVERTNFAFIE